MMLARMLELAGDDVTVILMSDHGFHPDHLRRRTLPSEPAGPAAEHRDFGIFVMRGAGIKRDELVHGVGLLDVTPTILTLFGLPTGDDMDGRPLVDAFEGPTPELLRSLFAFLAEVLETPITGVMKLIVSESGNFPQLARMYAYLVLRRAFALMRRILERGVTRGEFRPLDVEATVPLVISPIVLLGVWKHSFGLHTDLALDRRRVLEAHCEILLRGLAPQLGGRP